MRRSYRARIIDFTKKVLRIFEINRSSSFWFAVGILWSATLFLVVLERKGLYSSLMEEDGVACAKHQNFNNNNSPCFFQKRMNKL